MLRKSLDKKKGQWNFEKAVMGLTKILLYVMPACLYLSYWPVISLGQNETMNFELSVPLIWLVLFDGVVLVAMAKKRVLFEWLKGKRWLWLLFPVWVTLSLIWSVNVTRGVLTVGIMWLLFFAGYGMWALRDVWDEEFRWRWWKWFMGSTIVVCVWCFVQCILDLAGVSQDYSLMCDGCTYRMFGFPHPNGFAIEPQFMGNLLLAPAIAVIWKYIKGGRYVLPIVFVMTLFLTFSRGAIYAFMVGMGVMTVGVLVCKKHKAKAKRVWGAGGIVVCSFLLVLNVQGLMAQMGPTSDTYYDGVAKVLNHLSLGVIDIRGGEEVEQGKEEGNIEGELREDEFVLVEKPVENFEDNRGGDDDSRSVESGSEEAVFDGYVAESTDTRLRLTGAAMQIWSQDFGTMIRGVGIGGAGQALADAGLSPAPKEIVQNEYASLLLETGAIGVSLFVLMIALAVRVIWKGGARWALMGLLVAYGVSLFFFSGLANALQIYLMLAVMLVYKYRIA